jgi:hypothetical protein
VARSKLKLSFAPGFCAVFKCTSKRWSASNGLSCCRPQNFRKHIFNGSGRDLKNPKPRSTWHRHAIAFHQLDLISGNGRAREKFGDVSDRMPESEGKGQQKGSVARRGGKRSQQRSIGINPRPPSS